MYSTCESLVLHPLATRQVFIFLCARQRARADAREHARAGAHTHRHVWDGFFWKDLKTNPLDSNSMIEQSVIDHLN